MTNQTLTLDELIISSLNKPRSENPKIKVWNEMYNNGKQGMKIRASHISSCSTCFLIISKNTTLLSLTCLLKLRKRSSLRVSNGKQWSVYGARPYVHSWTSIAIIQAWNNNIITFIILVYSSNKVRYFMSPLHRSIYQFETVDLVSNRIIHFVLSYIRVSYPSDVTNILNYAKASRPLLILYLNLKYHFISITRLQL